MKGYSIGTRVSQASYGDGTITLANEYHTMIDFDEHGVRTFSTPLVQLAHTNTAAPVRAKGARRKKAAPKTARA
jgi:hypothetical protein